jgi:ribonuclease P protein component
MFKRENRLVPGIKFNNSHITANTQFVLKEKKNGLTINRFGVVVSKKIDNRAVVRNKIKRFFRMSLERLDKKLNTGHDMLFIVRKGILSKSKEENLLVLEGALEKFRFIKKRA